MRLSKEVAVALLVVGVAVFLVGAVVRRSRSSEWRTDRPPTDPASFGRPTPPEGVRRAPGVR